MYKEVFNFLAIALTFYAFFPYIQSIRTGKTKPHVFSWIIWGFATVVVFFAQIAGEAGLGAWSIGVSGVITFYVAFLAYVKRSDTTISKTDWVFFIVALSALPVWVFTSDPVWAVVVLTTVDTLGFGPTIRKLFHHPYEEKISFFFIFVVRNLFSIVALEHYSVTTVLFPAVMAVACLLVIILIAIRKRVLAPPNEN
jgi:hypothetical protein